MTVNNWVIANTKVKLNLKQICEGDTWNRFIVIHCIRKSDRGAIEDIYIAGAENELPKSGEKHSYVVDTGRGYGGRGTVTVVNSFLIDNKIIMALLDPVKVNENKKLPVYVFK